MYRNPLATASQLKSIITERGEIRRYVASNVITMVGRYLDLGQADIITPAIILLQRFCVVESPGETADKDVFPLRGVCLACILISMKLAGVILDITDLIRVSNFVFDRLPLLFGVDDSTDDKPYPPDMDNLAEMAQLTVEMEMEVLAGTGFNLRLVTPYKLALAYLRFLDKVDEDSVTETWRIISDSMRSSPWLSIAHQPNTIAIACISTYLKGKVPESVLTFFEVHYDDYKDALSLIRRGEHLDRVYKYEPADI